MLFKLLEEFVLFEGFCDKVVVVFIGMFEFMYVIIDEDIEVLCKCYGGKVIIFVLGCLVFYKGFEYLVWVVLMFGDDIVIFIGGEGLLCGVLELFVGEMGVVDCVMFLG